MNDDNFKKKFIHELDINSIIVDDVLNNNNFINKSLIDKKDLLSVQSQVFGYSNFSGVKKDSSDVDKNGVVDKKDLLMIQSHVFGYSKINQG